MGRTPDPGTLREQNLAFWEERGRSMWSGHTLTMLAEHERYVEYVHRMELRFLKDRLSSLPRPRVLDLGCGTGRLSIALASLAREVVGIEFAESLAARAQLAVKAQGLENVRIINGNIEDEIPRAYFDVAILSGVLNCLDDDAVVRALGQASRALVVNGMLYIRNNCANRDTFFRPAGPNQPPCVYRSASDYRRFVAATPGLEVSEDRYLFAPLCLPNLVYYHVLPKSMRDRALVTRVLDTWFRREERTSERRLRLFGRSYGLLMNAIGKPTSFRVLVAVQRGP